MKEVTTASIADLDWRDAEYSGYYWDPTSSEPTLILRVQRDKSPMQEMVCPWASNLKIDLSYRRNIGPLGVSDVKFISIDSQGWEIELEFAFGGKISFNSSVLTLRDVEVR